MRDFATAITAIVQQANASKARLAVEPLFDRASGYRGWEASLGDRDSEEFKQGFGSTPEAAICQLAGNLES